MADLYSSCPCGSGKKLKWCCHDIYQQLETIFRLDEEGQHESALRQMDELVAKKPGNAEVLGRKAQLLFVNEKVDAAEEVLNEALQINPKYAFAYLLRGTFRQHEGELAGAALLFRKAAELYDPEARDILSEVFARIAGCELRLNHPVAARFAYKKSLLLHPNQEMQDEFDTLFGEGPNMPESARKAYQLRDWAKSGAPDQHVSWTALQAAVDAGKLHEALALAEAFVAANPEDPAVLFNLGLIRAWMGENAKAVETLGKYVEMESDESRAADAWKLAQTLMFARGLEDQADFVQHTLLYQLRDPKFFFGLLDKLRDENRLVNVQISEDQTSLSGVLLEKAGSGLVTGVGTGLASGPAKLGAYLLFMGGIVRFWNTNPEALEKIRQEIGSRASGSMNELKSPKTAASFADVFTEALVFPVDAMSKESAVETAREHIRKYFEEKWTQKSLKSLGGLTPDAAAQNPAARKKLLGTLEFMQECSEVAGNPYDFSGMIQKYGFAAGPGVATAGQPAVQELQTNDIEALDASGLAALDAASLDPAQLDLAFRTAQRVGASESVNTFARRLTTLTDKAAAGSQFQAFSHLISQSLSAGKPEEAIELLDAGEKADCELNEGRRRNDFELRRGQVLAKLGDSEQSRTVFERLLERVPGELKYCGTATETMLSAKQGKTALEFAERGLAKAREKNDRDSEQYFMELAAAARKQVG
jgi:tetratricopeptide (TPR) repeat protein